VISNSIAISSRTLFAPVPGVLVVRAEVPQPFRSAARLRTSRHKVAVPQKTRACVLAVARKITRSQTRTRKAVGSPRRHHPR